MGVFEKGHVVRCRVGVGPASERREFFGQLGGGQVAELQEPSLEFAAGGLFARHSGGGSAPTGKTDRQDGDHASNVL
jgi:hypothetical protein